MHSNSVIFVVLCSLLGAAINSSFVFYVFAVKGKVRYTVIRTNVITHKHSDYYLYLEKFYENL
jgi:hypothetical protein